MAAILYGSPCKEAIERRLAAAHACPRFSQRRFRSAMLATPALPTIADQMPVLEQPVLYGRIPLSGGPDDPVNILADRADMPLT